MANNKSTEKRIRQSELRKQRNRSHRTRLRTAVKRLRLAIEENDGDKAREMLGETLSLVDHTAQKGVIHRNAAARAKSRLTRAVAALG